MSKPLMRIPYTGPLPPPVIFPRSANTSSGAIHAISKFLFNPSDSARGDGSKKTVLLTGAGISVASGLADYRGTGGTYTLNKTYRPIYYHEFISNHEARKRYWARSFLGWTNLNRAKPNVAHYAVRDLGSAGLLSSVITQNVDSFHSTAHPRLKTIELHGYLRSLVCIHCHNELPRKEFQKDLTTLNPAWAAFLDEMLAVGALDSENPDERKAKGLRSNPDGDVDVPNAPYSTFRYPACPTCLATPPTLADGSKAKVEIDHDGAWSPSSTAGVLKPAVIMFGESIHADVKSEVEKAIDDAARVLVVGSSLATYSAFRLIKKAKGQGKPIGILNLGGIRGEQDFFTEIPAINQGELGVRCNESASSILPLIVDGLKRAGVFESNPKIWHEMKWVILDIMSLHLCECLHEHCDSLGI
ncbi:uncharacterized protein KY384_008290 [Bacidia gigantensis]|uniref:uncharacterized protein n=1 Tax=Bacidia gigantensis TaxID=2732470 RepID=UPI001D04D255|nr:uncharacterized protein KY384_008290 [Bacidia gigantensis]KAG8526861.1 hypothetical protein KY384_008290 [Bacidia gigantensis]